MSIISKIEEKLTFIETPFSAGKRLDPLAIEIEVKRMIEARRRNILGKLVAPNLVTIVVVNDCYRENEALLDKIVGLLLRHLKVWLLEKGYETVHEPVIRFRAGTPGHKLFVVEADFQEAVAAVREGYKVTAGLFLVHVPSGNRTPITGEQMMIGRGERCSIRIDDPTVSGEHACLCEEYGKIIIEDLGSTNGTRVNRERINMKVVNEGDRIGIGNDEWVIVKDQL